jgi:hypothetical protein
MNNIEQYPVHIPENQREADDNYYNQLARYHENSIGMPLDKLRAFTKYTPVAEINRFLAKNELFKKILHVHGNVVECGVFNGAGLMAWANFSSIYEPLNHTRKIIGFDTFDGFVNIDGKDQSSQKNLNLKPQALKVNSHSDILECVKVFDIYRPLGHINKVELVKGDVSQSIDDYINSNQHLLVALLYLDFDLYEPTRVALTKFLPRMCKGSILAFDELNLKYWPGETIALLEQLKLCKYKISRFSFQPQISYIEL